MTERMAVSEVKNNFKNLILSKKRQIIKICIFFFKNVSTFVRDTILKKVYRRVPHFFRVFLDEKPSRKCNKIEKRTYESSSKLGDFTLKVPICCIVSSEQLPLKPYYSRGRIVNSTLRVTLEGEFQILLYESLQPEGNNRTRCNYYRPGTSTLTTETGHLQRSYCYNYNNCGRYDSLKQLYLALKWSNLPKIN